MDNLPAGESHLEEHRQAQLKDEVCKQVMDYCEVGWPQRHQVEGLLCTLLERERPTNSKQQPLTI